MLFQMTSPIMFNEKEFINEVVDCCYNDNTRTLTAIFQNKFESSFPTDEICRFIANKYYPGENYDGESLYSILYNKVEDSIYDDLDSDADTDDENYQN